MIYPALAEHVLCGSRFPLHVMSPWTSEPNPDGGAHVREGSS